MPDDESKVKKAILIRYPFTFMEKVSKDLATYSYWWENRKTFKACAILDGLIDAVTIDPVTSKRWWDMPESDRDRFILIPKDLVTAFRVLWHGPRSDGIPALKWLSPGPNLDPGKDIVHIKQPIKLREVVGDRPTEYSALVLGFSYKVQTMSPSGFPITETLPMIPWDDPDIDNYYTNTIPYSVWCEFYEANWELLSPICTRIERIIAQRLEQSGIGAGEPEISESEVGDSDEGGEFAV